jgi:hypothetical protein
MSAVDPAKTQAELTKQFDTAADIAKALLTLSTAILTLTITFLKDITTTATAADKVFLGVGWAFFFISICGGIWLLYAVLGSEKEIAAGTAHTVYDGNTAVPMAVQQLCFLVGVLALGAFGVAAF